MVYSITGRCVLSALKLDNHNGISLHIHRMFYKNNVKTSKLRTPDILVGTFTNIHPNGMFRERKLGEKTTHRHQKKLLVSPSLQSVQPNLKIVWIEFKLKTFTFFFFCNFRKCRIRLKVTCSNDTIRSTRIPTIDYGWWTESETARATPTQTH